MSKSPGRYRRSEIYVHDDRSERAVYEGPAPELVPELMRGLVADLASGREVDPRVTAAMAHLNLVLIHPFRDGNGRMARAVQTMVLARDQVLEPTFASIEEWLGHNTDDYYRILAVTGGGSWSPDRDTRLWLKFSLRAHHMQAQTLQRRFTEAEELWRHVDEVIAEHSLPERTGDPLFDALLGVRITRPTYVKRAGLEVRTATRDLARLVDAGLLEPRGQTRGRHYVAGDRLGRVHRAVRAQRPGITDPYPSFSAQLARAARA